MLAVVAVAVAALIAAMAAKFWASIQLLNRFTPAEYLSVPEARRLYVVCRVSPVVGCLSLVTLSFCTGLLWIELPALLFFTIIAVGVLWRSARDRNRYA